MSKRALASSVGSRAGQRGVSLIAILLIICIVVFFGAVAFTMMPSYLSFLQVRSAMDGLREKPDVVARGPHAIRGALVDQLFINDVHSIKANQFKIEKKRGHYNLAVDYEVRRHLLANVDVVMNFAHEVQLER